MLFLFIYLALWVITFAYAVYESHKKVKPIPFVKSYKFFRLKTADPWWFLLLFSAIMAPISIVVWLIDWIRSKNKKKNSNSAKTNPADENISIHIADRLPNDHHTEISIACANALVNNKWDEFARYLTYQTTFLDLGIGETKDCISELNEISRYIQTTHSQGTHYQLSVEICKFYARTCVVINSSENHDQQYILFRIIDGQLTHIVHTPLTVNPGINYNPFNDLPFTTEFLDKRCYGDYDEEPIKYHLPCFACGAPSELLRWRRLSLKNTQYVIDGVVSICPHCHREAECYVDTQTEIPKPKTTDDEDLPF